MIVSLLIFGCQETALVVMADALCAGGTITARNDLQLLHRLGGVRHALQWRVERRLCHIDRKDVIVRIRRLLARIDEEMEALAEGIPHHICTP